VILHSPQRKTEKTMQLLILIAAMHALPVEAAASSSFLHRLDNTKLHVQHSVIANESSIRQFVNGTNAKSAPRRVYIDLGANWANTMRLFEDIGAKRAEKPWEVYAFEASPFIQPYLEKFTAWLNGQGAKPPVTVPPSGSTAHLNMFASRYGCPVCGAQPVAGRCNAMRNCMFNLFRGPLSRLYIDPSLKDWGLINSRLNMAKGAPPSENRFVAVPAAAGANGGMLNLGMMTAEQMIRGGANSKGIGHTVSVPMVDFPTWLAQSFTAEKTRDPL